MPAVRQGRRMIRRDECITPWRRLATRSDYGFDYCPRRSPVDAAQASSGLASDQSSHERTLATTSMVCCCGLWNCICHYWSEGG